MRNTIILILAVIFTISCSSQKNSTTSQQPDTQQKERPSRSENERPGDRKAPPSVDEVFEWDVNKDGKLSIEEVQGRLKKDFTKIDADGDGFISRTELENAPKPQRGKRPPGN